MKYFCILFGAFLFSGPAIYAQTAANTEPVQLQKDFTAWWNYYNDQTKLSADFIALDTLGKSMSKESFLKILTSGDYIPVRQKLNNEIIVYRLYKLSEPDKGIRPTIQFQAEIEYAYFMMAGKEVPDFNFTDIEGKVYNKETTKGKILVLKCWFIHCPQCVAEMPMLNKMVKEYKNRKDVVFVSLAYDTKEELQEFLRSNAFTYAIVPGKQTYMNDQLKIIGYPTHMIIKDGVIVKVISNGDELVNSLKKETSR